MSTTGLKGTRVLDAGITSAGRRKRKDVRKPVGMCRICGQVVRWGESYHATNVGLTHLRCEWGGEKGHG